MCDCNLAMVPTSALMVEVARRYLAAIVVSSGPDGSDCVSFFGNDDVLTRTAEKLLDGYDTEPGIHMPLALD